jgi:hypothetical protein
MKTPQIDALPGMTPLGFAPATCEWLDYTVHFQKGTRIGTRSLRMEHVQAATASQAVAMAKRLFPDFRAQKYRIVRVDHFDANSIVVDYQY